MIIAFVLEVVVVVVVAVIATEVVEAAVKSFFIQKILSLRVQKVPY
jgi:hypothetical protein